MRCIKERRATILVGHSFCSYVTEVGGTFPLYSHPSVVGLISGTSAVSLFPRPEEKTRLLSSSRLSLVPRPRPAFRSQATESWVGPGKLQSRETTSAAALSFVLGLPVCVHFALLFQQHGALCHVRFYVSFSPPSFAGSFAGHFENNLRWCHIDNPEASLREHDGSISTTLRFTLGCETAEK